MKIVMAVHHFPPKYTAGAEKVAYQAIKGLQELGNEVKVICVEDIHNGSVSGISSLETIYDGIPVYRLSYEANSFPDPDRFEYDNPWIGDYIANFLQEVKPDVFHLVSGYLITGRAVRCAKELGIPTIISLEDFWFLCKRINLLRSDGKVSRLPVNPVNCARCIGEEKRRMRLPGAIFPGLMQQYWELQHDKIKAIEDRMIFQQETLNQADMLIGRSKFLCSSYVEAGVDPARITFSRQGIDESVFPMPLVEKRTTPFLRIGYIGQIAWHKGVHILLNAIRKLPDMPLNVKVYGNTKAIPDYTRQLLDIASKDNRIEIAGLVQTQDLLKVLAELDVLVVPSLCYENSPNVILEAFTQKLPVIASNMGGMAELVQHERNGMLFEPGNASDLAFQIKRIVGTPQLLQRFQENIPVVKTVDQELDELVALYEKIMANDTRSRILDAEL